MFHVFFPPVPQRPPPLSHAPQAPLPPFSISLWLLPSNMALNKGRLPYVQQKVWASDIGTLKVENPATIGFCGCVQQCGT